MHETLIWLRFHSVSGKRVLAFPRFLDGSEKGGDGLFTSVCTGAGNNKQNQGQNSNKNNTCVERADRKKSKLFLRLRVRDSEVLAPTLEEVMEEVGSSGDVIVKSNGCAPLKTKCYDH